MENFEVYEGSNDLPVVVSCEHASGFVPEELNNLGVSMDELNSCNYLMDRGAEGAYDFLVAKLGCNGIKARVSRLVIDVNRDLDQKSLIRTSCGPHSFKGNKDITEEEKKDRVEKYYLPYRNKLHDLLLDCEKKHGVCFYFSIHTMENCFEKERREMDFAIIYNKGEKVAKKLGESLEKNGHVVTYNNPYTLKTDIIRVTHDSEVMKFNEFAVVVEINDGLVNDPNITESLFDAIKSVAEDYSSQK
jgi:predicted N-formylglutamate amidohydrolase